jgi:hypothetical protein
VFVTVTEAAWDIRLRGVHAKAPAAVTKIHDR